MNRHQFFTNKNGEITSFRSKNGIVTQTIPYKHRKSGGTTAKYGGITTRMGSSSNVRGLGMKYGAKTAYFSSLGKRRNSITPY